MNNYQTRRLYYQTKPKTEVDNANWGLDNSSYFSPFSVSFFLIGEYIQYSPTVCKIIIVVIKMMAQSSGQATFTSEFVGSILATDSCKKSPSTLCRKSWDFSRRSGFLPQGKLTGWG
jgi:hypothetical protein